jgi:hypothetical protein
MWRSSSFALSLKPSAAYPNHDERRWTIETLVAPVLLLADPRERAAPQWRCVPLRSRPLVPIATLAFLYFVTGRIGLSLGAVGSRATAVWPPTGLALAALRVGPNLWPGIALGVFAVNVAAGAPWWAAAFIAAGNTTAGVETEAPMANPPAKPWWTA